MSLDWDPGYVLSGVPLAHHTARMFWRYAFLLPMILILLDVRNVNVVDANYFKEHVDDVNDVDTGRPFFRETENNITVGRGERAMLKCKVENLGTKTVTWSRKDQSVPITIGLYTFTADTRISVDFNQRTNEWNLLIQAVGPEDAGVYQCQISTKDDRENTYDITLNVKAVQVTGTEYVERGGQMTLTCNATGKPDPPNNVQWLKDGRILNSDARRGILITTRIETKVLISRLIIQRSEMPDSGEYMCRASNGDRANIMVMILNVPAQGAVGKRESSETIMFRSSAPWVSEAIHWGRSWRIWLSVGVLLWLAASPPHTAPLLPLAPSRLSSRS